MSVIHIIPRKDIEEHIETIVTQDWSRSNTINYCMCAPKVSREHDSILVIHNSFEGKEYSEENTKINIY